jgi:acyl-CoA thioester hydrolase
MARESFRCSFPIRVRWSEVDRQGIVFNGHYLNYFDVAVTEYWRAIGCEYPRWFEEHRVDTFVVKATLEYHRPAGFDDELVVLVRVIRLGRTSLTVGLEVHRAEEHLVTGQVIYVVADPDSRRPQPIPEAFRTAILGYEVVSPETAFS